MSTYRPGTPRVSNNLTGPGEGTWVTRPRVQVLGIHDVRGTWNCALLAMECGSPMEGERILPRRSGIGDKEMGGSRVNEPFNLLHGPPGSTVCGNQMVSELAA